METANYKSLILTGDLKGFDYLKSSAKTAPKSAFNFCCTVDGTCSGQDVDLGTMKPEKKKKNPNNAAHEQWLRE